MRGCNLVYSIVPKFNFSVLTNVLCFVRCYLTLGEAGQTQKDKEGQISYDIAYMWNLKKNGTNEPIYKTEIESQTQKTNLWIPRGKKREG